MTRRAWPILLLFGGVLFPVAGAVVFIAVDASWGRAAAIAAVASLLLLPLAIGVVSERVAKAITRKELRAEAMALPLVSVACIGAALLAFLVWPAKTGAAFKAAPERYAWGGFLADTSRRIGRSLVADPKGKPSASASSSAPSASPPPGSDGPRPSAPGRREPPAPPAPPAAADTSRFVTGDPSYREPDCSSLGDVSDIERAHQPGKLRATVEALAARRYPMGVPFLQAQDDAQLAVWFHGDESFEGVESGFETAVHEGCHLWGFKKFNGRTVTYAVRGDLIVEAKRLQNFNRSEILSEHVDAASDTYASTYLEGKSGAQGFNTLLDEYNAYAHSLASRFCTRDLLPKNRSTSARDGILTMMYYVGTYLRIARTRHPKDYAAIVADPGHRRVILSVWDRAEFWLRLSAPHRSLGIADEKIARWTYAPDNVAEIRRIRDADKSSSDSPPVK